MAALLQQPAHPGRMGSGFYGYAQRPLRSEASFEGCWGGVQPALLDYLTVLLIDEAQVGVFVAYVQSGCRLWLVFATIYGGPILLTILGVLESVECLQTQRVLRTWGSAFSSHLRRIPLLRRWVNKPRSCVS